MGKEDTQIDNDKDDKDENKFMLNYDANSFTHSSNSNKYLTAGFKGVKDYKLDESYFNKLIKYSTKGEKNRIKQSMNSSWGGPSGYAAKSLFVPCAGNAPLPLLSGRLDL